ncbi:hypothetical protein PTKIN_Ptkin08bG0140800 [Pterospermum kingtungense]
MGRKGRTKVCAKRLLKSNSKRQWTKQEDVILVQCLHQLAEDLRWKKDNGTFRPGYLTRYEKMMETKFPQLDLKANPHIDSRDRPIGQCVETSADAVETDDRNEEDEFEDTNHEIGEEKEATYVAIEDSNCHTIDTPASDKVGIWRKRSRISDGFDELVDQIKKFGITYEKTMKEISRITTFFK